MRKLPLLLAAAIAAIAVLSSPPAHAQAKCGTDICMGSKTSATHVKGSLFLENTSGVVAFTPNPDGGLTTLVTANNAINATTKALINYDFPSLSTAAGALNCADSSTAAIASCPFGSQLSIGVDQVLVNGNGNLNPYLSAANTAFVRACASAPDAGTFNMPDASYIVRCIP